MGKDIRLKKFYELLDNLMCENVESINNSINDEEWNESENRVYNESDKRTFDNFGTTIYNWIVETKDFKFLGENFIMEEIKKYFNKSGYWSEIRQQYELEKW